MASPNLVEAIQVLQRQQLESMARMDELTAQHRQWHSAMAELLAQVEAWRPEELEPPEALEPVMDSGRLCAESVKLAVVPGEAVDMQPELSEDLDEATPRGPRERSKRTTLKLERQGRLQKLVNEVMLDHHEEGDHGEGSWWQMRRRALYKFVNSSNFEYITSVVIMLNMVLIGVEAELSIQQGSLDWANWMERIFLVVYTLELILRLLAKGFSIVYNRWFQLDLFLVLVGILALVVLPLLGDVDGLEGFDKVLVVRGLRLLRLARALRMVGYFRIIWRLVYGVLTAGNTMLSTTCLMMLWLFIFGCVAVEVITKDMQLWQNAETAEIVRDQFGTLPRSILTLLQFVTLDSIAQIYFPLIMAKPWLVIFFMPMFLFLSVGLMNLVTAVLVEHALEHAAHEQDAERLKTKQKIKAALPALLDIFHHLDADASGCVTKKEIEGVSLDMLPPKLLEAVSVDSMSDLFELLDVDGGGTLTQAEFVEGLLNLVLLDVPIWTIQSLKLLRLIRGMTVEINENLKCLTDPSHRAPLVEP